MALWLGTFGMAQESHCTRMATTGVPWFHNITSVNHTGSIWIHVWTNEAGQGPNCSPIFLGKRLCHD